MTTRYEVVGAKTKAEALEKSVWKVGTLARVIGVQAVGNSEGTFSVFPIIEPVAEGSSPGLATCRCSRESGR